MYLEETKRHVSVLQKEKSFLSTGKQTKHKICDRLKFVYLNILIFKSQKIYVYLYYFLLILRVFYNFSIVSNSGSTLETGNENRGSAEQLPFTRFCCCLTPNRIKRNVSSNIYGFKCLKCCKSYSISFTHLILYICINCMYIKKSV